MFRIVLLNTIVSIATGSPFFGALGKSGQIFMVIIYLIENSCII